MSRPEDLLGPVEAARPEPEPGVLPVETSPPVPRFPLGALPTPCARLAREQADAVPCPPDFVAVPMLGVAAGVIGATRRLELRPGYREAPRLFLTPCGPPGSGKSPGFRVALRPAWAWQDAARAEHEAATLVYERVHVEHEAALARWRAASKKQDAGPPPDAPPEPVMARLVVDDHTIEVLADKLAQNPRGLLMANDELAGWVNGIGQYKQGRGADRQRWLTLWTGAPLTVDRKGAEPVMVARPLVVVVGGIQPDALPVLVAEHGANDGFADRVLVSYPDPVPLAVSDAGVSAAAEAGWAELVGRLHALAPGGDGEPVTLTLDAEARAEWRAWRERLVAERNRAPEHLAGPLAKLEAHAGRLALVAHELRRAGGEGGAASTLDAESLRRGLALADYFAGHFPRVYARLEDARQAVGRRRPGARGPAPERRGELAGRVMAELERAEAPLALAELARAVGEDPKSRTLREARDELVEQGRVVREGDRYRLPRETRHPDTNPTPRMDSAVSGVSSSVEFPAGVDVDGPEPPAGHLALLPEPARRDDPDDPGGRPLPTPGAEVVDQVARWRELLPAEAGEGGHGAPEARGELADDPGWAGPDPTLADLAALDPGPAAPPGWPEATWAAELALAAEWEETAGLVLLGGPVGGA